MANGKLRVGLIGCGGIAPTHLNSYRQNELAEVVAVADVDENRAASLARQAGATAYVNYVEMIDKEKLDAVSLLTPPASHREIAETVLSAKIHVFCEKPLATTSADAEAMAEAARRAGKLLMVAQCHRFHEPVRRAKAIIQGGELGEVSTYRNRFGYSRGTPDERTRGRGGVLLDNGSHSTYLFRFLVGPVESAFGWAPVEQRHRIEEICVCMLLLESVSGAGGVVELDGAGKPCPSVIQVFGDRGTIFIDYSAASYFRPASGGEPVRLDDPSLSVNHRFDREVNHFIRCVLGEEEPEIGAEEGVADLRVLEACYKSITTGEKVMVSKGDLHFMENHTKI